MINIGKEMLSAEVHEGTVIILDNRVVRIDKSEEKDRVLQIKKKMDDLWE